MDGSSIELRALLRSAAEDPHSLLQLRRLAESAGCLRGYETEAELLDSLAEAGELGRLGEEGLLTDGNTGAWAELRTGPEFVPEEADEETAAGRRTEASETFDQDEQAATLVTASTNGTPFCEVCERARLAREAAAA